MPKKYSIFEYQYRDASNYKSYGEILVEGKFLKKDINLIHSCMYDFGEYFIPEEIGIPPLQYKIWEKCKGRNNDDHEWHSILCIREAKQDEMQLPLWGTKKILIESFTKNWNKKPDWLKQNKY